MRRRFVNSYIIRNNYTLKYFTFTNTGVNPVTISLIQNTTTQTLNYRLNKWTTSTSIELLPSQSVELKGEYTPISSYGIGTFNITGDSIIDVKGNVMSLLYGDNFKEQTSLSGKSYAFCKLFNGCTNIVDTSNLILPSTTLTTSCYNSMFRSCTSLVNTPELPATTLDVYCYEYMFRECTSLVNAPELPATALAKECYYGMFYKCTNLTTAPELPATTLVDGCYYAMFLECTSLINAPVLPATTLTDHCYESMFGMCTSLINAPKLPAVTLAYECYDWMFEGCISLTIAPELPATTLVNGCYRNMFLDCTKLTVAPELPAAILVDRCYYSMFSGCTSLNQITMLATDINASDCLTNWVNGVASSGTFTKHKDMKSLLTSANGIPSGWTVIDKTEPNLFDVGDIVYKKDGEFFSVKSSVWESSLGEPLGVIAFKDDNYGINLVSLNVYGPIKIYYTGAYPLIAEGIYNTDTLLLYNSNFNEFLPRNNPILHYYIPSIGEVQYLMLNSVKESLNVLNFDIYNKTIWSSTVPNVYVGNTHLKNIYNLRTGLSSTVEGSSPQYEVLPFIKLNIKV